MRNISTHIGQETFKNGSESPFIMKIDARTIFQYLATHPMYMGRVELQSQTQQLRQLHKAGVKLGVLEERVISAPPVGMLVEGTMSAPQGTQSFKEWYQNTLNDLCAEAQTAPATSLGIDDVITMLSNTAANYVTVLFQKKGNVKKAQQFVTVANPLCKASPLALEKKKHNVYAFDSVKKQKPYLNL